MDAAALHAAIPLQTRGEEFTRVRFVRVYARVTLNDPSPTFESGGGVRHLRRTAQVSGSTGTPSDVVIHWR